MKLAITSELRHGLGKYAIWLYTFLIALTTFASLRPGVYLWVDATMGINLAMAAVNPLAAGLACLAAGIRSRHARVRLAGASRSRLAPTGIHLASVAAAPTLAFILVLIAVSIWITMHDGAGMPIWGWIFSTYLGALASIVVGYFVGWLLGFHWYLPPAIALGSYLAWGAAANASGPYHWLITLMPTNTNGSNLFVTYINRTILGQSLWYIGLIAVLFFVIVQFGAHRILVHSALPILAGGAVVAIIGSALVASTNGQFTHGHNPRIYTCAGRAPVICVNPGFARGIPQLEEAFRALNGRVEGTPLVAKKLEQNVQGIGDHPSKGARSLYVEDLGADFAQQSVAKYVFKYGGAEQCTNADSFVAHDIVGAWMTGTLSVPSNDKSAIAKAARRFSDMTDSQRTSWFSAHSAALLSCTLDLDDL